MDSYQLVQCQIKDFTGNSSWYPTTQADKWVKIQCPPNGYSSMVDQYVKSKATKYR